MEYLSLVEELNGLKEEEFASFQAKLVPIDKSRIIGVRTPILRTLVKKYRAEWKTLLTFSDEFYEVTFIKLNVCALLPYEEFCSVLPTLVKSIDNWATCDTFKAKCIKKHKEEFLPRIREFSKEGGFITRYALVTLLSFYVEEKYLKDIFSVLKEVNGEDYYVSMAAAWLTAEVLIKHFEEGKTFLLSGALDDRTKNRAIQKARESFRIDDEKKAELLKLKTPIKNAEMKM